MKIVILVQKLTGGGAERVAALWADGFAGRGHNVTLLLNDWHKTKHQYLVSSKVNILNRSIPLSNNFVSHFFNKLLKSTGFLKYRYKKILYNIDPDYIIGIMPPHAYNAKQLCPNLKAIYINTEHNAFERPNDAPLTSEQIYYKFEQNRHVDYVTVLTEADRKVLGSSYKNVTVLPNPLPFEPLEKVPVKRNLLLAAGRFSDWYIKGFDILIKSWGDIAKNYPDWILQIAGTGNKDDQATIKRLVKKCGAEKQIQLLGFCEDMKSVYSEASIFIMSSRYEGFGMVLLEAMSQGCACIVSDFRGRQREILTNDIQGLVIEEINSYKLSSAIKKMIEDDDYRKNCQQNAMERSKYYTIDEIMNRWEDIFKKISICAKG